MGEDNRVPPLPRRVRGTGDRPGAAARVTPPMLSESALQRIRAAFYAEPAQAVPPGPAVQQGQAVQPGQAVQQGQAPSVQRPAPVPRPVPGANDGLRRPAAEPETGRRAPAMRVPAQQRSGHRSGGQKAPPRRVLRWAGGTASVVLIVAGSLAFALSRHTAAPTAGGGHGLTAEMATRNLAAAWVADQVSRDAIVSCDPAMCQVLEAHGISDGDLLELGPGTADPLGSNVIVATAAVRSEFGDRLSAVYAPAVMASFGSGNRRIIVRAIAPDGAAAYRSALSADLLARKASGTQLLRNPRVVASPAIRRQLAAGRVDARLLTTIAGLASLQPVDIVAFGAPAPGAGAGSPLSSADLAETGGAAHPGSPAGLRSLLAFLRAQRPPYLAAHVEIVPHTAGPAMLFIEFSAPSPLGLLSPAAP